MADSSCPYRLSHINALHINQFYWPKDQSMKFSQKNIENWPFWIFFSKKKNFFFASSPWKLVTNYVLEWMGLNFYYNDGLQPKMRAGIINEHECIYSRFATIQVGDSSTRAVVVARREHHVMSVQEATAVLHHKRPVFVWEWGEK